MHHRNGCPNQHLDDSGNPSAKSPSKNGSTTPTSQKMLLHRHEMLDPSSLKEIPERALFVGIHSAFPKPADGIALANEKVVVTR
jgi:hypothetical protein